jgi:predicted kinase
MDEKLAARVALRHMTAGALEDVSKLRWQAVFLMGAGGSGKGFVGRKWMKYMPGGGSKGIDFDDPKQKELAERRLTEMERGQSNITFEKAQQALAEKYNIRLTPIPGGQAKIPFVLHTYDGSGNEIVLKEQDWKKELPEDIYKQVEGLKDVIFDAPKYEIPSFWRQVDPDLYKKELAGYSEKQPGYVHEMSSAMAKGYYEAILETGDPLFVDGTGTNVKKMATYLKEAKEAGYRTSLVFVAVPLVVNQIRNATRTRNVNPNIVTNQWRKIPTVYDAIKGMADKAKVIVNRADRMDVNSYRAYADKINEFIRKNTSFDSLYDLIKKEAPNELKDWGKVLKQDAGQIQRDKRFDRLEEKRKERGLAPREYVLAKRVRNAYMGRQAAVTTIREKCQTHLNIDKIKPYGTPAHGQHHFQLFGRVVHEPGFGFPIKFVAHVVLNDNERGMANLGAIHTERSGKVTPKIFSEYVETLLRKNYGLWAEYLPR